MQNLKISGIYCIENKVTGKKYIGQSCNINDRWYKHKNELNSNCHDNDFLQNDWDEYGEDNFIFTILEICDVSDLDSKEIYYINYYNTLDNNCGYNLKSGGQNGGCKASDYVREKLSTSVKKSYDNNPELIEKRKNDAIKQWSNPSIKEKITGENNGMYGKHHTDEAKEKISKSRLGKPSWNKNFTPVICIELNRIFSCVSDAAKEMGLCSSSIIRVCKGERKTCGGYHWNFKLENNIG